MPNIGTETIGDTDRGMDQVLRGIQITMPAGSFAAGVSITAHIRNPSGSENWAAAIYATGATNADLLAQSAIRTNIATSYTWETFSGGGLATFTPAASTSYLIVVASEANADAEIRFVAGSGVNQNVDSVNPVNMTVEPMNADGRNYSIYMTYSDAATGVKRMLLLGAG